MDRVLSDLTANIIEVLKIQIPLDGNSLAQFSYALKLNNSLKRIDFSSVQLKAEHVSGILKGLDGNRTLQELDLRGSDLRAGALKLLLSNLCTQQNIASGLHTLLLDRNGLDEQIAQDLAFISESAHHLRRLSFRNNRLGNSCAAQLANSLCTNDTIENLDLGQNAIGGLGCTALIRMLDKNSKLLYMALDGNDEIDNSQLDAVTKKTAANRSQLAKLRSSRQGERVSSNDKTQMVPQSQLSPCTKNLIKTLSSIRFACKGLHVALDEGDFDHFEISNGGESHSSEFRRQKELLKCEMDRLESLEKDLHSQMRSLVASEKAVYERSKLLQATDRELRQRASHLELWAAQIADQQRMSKPSLVKAPPSCDKSHQTEPAFETSMISDSDKVRLNPVGDYEERMKYEERRMSKLNSVWERQMVQLELLEKELLCRAQELVLAEDNVVAKINETAEKQGILLVKEHEIDAQVSKLFKVVQEAEHKKIELEQKEQAMEKNIQAILLQRETLNREQNLLSEREKHLACREISFAAISRQGGGIDSSLLERDHFRLDVAGLKSKEDYLQEKEKRLELLQEDIAERDAASKALQIQLNELLAQMKRKERELKHLEAEYSADVKRRDSELRSEETSFLELLSHLERSIASQSGSPPSKRTNLQVSTLPVKERIRAIKSVFDQDNQALQAAWTQISKMKAVVEHKESLLDMEVEKVRSRSNRLLLESSELKDRLSQLHEREAEYNSAINHLAGQERRQARFHADEFARLGRELKHLADVLQQCTLAAQRQEASLAVEGERLADMNAKMLRREQSVYSREAHLEGREREIAELSVVAERYSSALVERTEEVNRRERVLLERESELRGLGAVAEQYGQALEAKDRELRRREMMANGR